jgi:hypothetical protein
MRASSKPVLPVVLVFLASTLIMPGLAVAQASQPKLMPTHITTAVQSGSQGSYSSATSTPPSFRGHRPPINVNYDEQIGMTFTQNFTSLEYNVTAVEQTDPTLGTGPGYLLNGLSNTGNWYQVGLSWDWSPGIGFSMSYEVFNSLGNSIYPTDGGGGLLGFSGTVNAGDNVSLNLYFNASGQVVMLAEDAETGAYAQVAYTAAGSTFFVGQPNGDATSMGFFTGLMTEWYHGQPYYSNPLQVVYSSNLPISSGWLWMDEFNANNGSLVFSANATAPSTFNTNPTQLQEFAYSGITEYANSLEFITGAASNSTTTTTSTTGSSTAVSSTQTVTTTLPITITQTATVTMTSTTTATTTTTVVQPVTTTATSTQSTTITETTTSTAPPSTTTTTQTTTQTTTASSIGALPAWSYALMVILLFGGIVTGYLLKRQTVESKRPQSLQNDDGQR